MDGFGSDLIFCIALHIAPVNRVHARRVNKSWNEALTWYIRDAARRPVEFTNAYEYAICMNDALASFVIRHALDECLLMSIYRAAFYDKVRKTAISPALHAKLTNMFPGVGCVSNYMPHLVAKNLRSLVIDNVLVTEACHVLRQLEGRNRIDTLHLSCTDKVTKAGATNLRIRHMQHLRALTLEVDTDTPNTLLRSLLKADEDRVYTLLEHITVCNRSNNRTHLECMAPIALLMCNVPYCKLENCLWVCGASCILTLQFADLAKRRRTNVLTPWFLDVDLRDLKGDEILRLA
jgi:hypothetical protein